MGTVTYKFEPGTNITIDWGDGVVRDYGEDSEGNIGVVRDSSDVITHIEATHEYVEEGLYDIKVWGTITGVLHSLYNLVDLKQWGETEIQRFGRDSNSDLPSLFYNVQDFTISAEDIPTLPTDCSFDSLFSRCNTFNSDIGHWDTDNVISLKSCFEGASLFNQDLSNWRTGRVTDMSWCFSEALVFDGPVNTWDTVSCLSMEAMFYFAKIFDQPLDLWNVSNVRSMFSMFNGAESFNQNLSNWNVANVSECQWFAQDAPINGTEKMPPLTCSLESEQPE